MIIRVGALLSESFSNGPGCRSVLWVQGCSRHCPGCWNPELLSPGKGIKMPVKEVFTRLTVSGNIEGVTLLGGEPFEQAEALVELSKHLKKKRLSIMAYSGWTIEQLKEKGGACWELVELCDLLIDGKFLRAKAAPLLWRGSTNQNIHFITDKYRYLGPMVNDYNRDFEIMVTGDQLVLTGDPPAEIKGLLKNIFTPKQNRYIMTNQEA